MCNCFIFREPHAVDQPTQQNNTQQFELQNSSLVLSELHIGEDADDR